MAVKIKLTRLGKIRNPQYRVAVADARTRRDGRSIEVIGRYHPKEEPSLIEIDSERAQYWLSVGAQPTDPVLKLLKITGDWQKFKGLPGAEGTLEVAEVKPNKIIAFEAAVKAAADEPKTKPKPKPKLEKVVEDVVEKAEEAAEKVAEVVEDVVEKAAETVKDAVEDIVEKVEEAVHGDKADETPAAEDAAAGESAEEAKA